jgi:alkylhydroperoxidase family enzyme
MSAKPRIPYLPSNLSEPAELVAAIRKRRGGDLLELDRILLHSPPLASGWNTMMGNVRRDLSLPPKLRELAMCMVAVLNRAEYELFHHAPLLIDAGGTPEQVQALRDPQRAMQDRELFDDTERAVLALTFESTRQVEVSDATFEALRAALPDSRQVVELVAVIASYNMVSRILVCLGIEPH